MPSGYDTSDLKRMQENLSRRGPMPDTARIQIEKGLESAKQEEIPEVPITGPETGNSKRTITGPTPTNIISTAQLQPESQPEQQSQSATETQPQPAPSKTQPTQSQQAPGETIPATLKAQSDWNAVGKYMYLPNHPKAVNGYVQINKGDVLYARQKLNLPIEQPEAQAPTQPQNQATSAVKPVDNIDKQAVGVPLDERNALLKEYQKYMKQAKRIRDQYTRKGKEFLIQIEQIRASNNPNKEAQIAELKKANLAEKQRLNTEYHNARQAAGQIYERLRG